MTLHRDPNLFREAILLTAETQGLSQALIEKDYWVTWVLRNLAESTVAPAVVFKGGTSLSKAYRLTDRFSEDVDLAVLLEGRTPAAIKTLIRDVHHAAVAVGSDEELPEVPGDGKRGRFGGCIIAIRRHLRKPRPSRQKQFCWKLRLLASPTLSFACHWSPTSAKYSRSEN